MPLVLLEQELYAHTINTRRQTPVQEELVQELAVGAVLVDVAVLATLAAVVALLALPHVAPLAPPAILAHALVDSQKAVQQD